MNRRSFIQSLVSLPVVALFPKFLLKDKDSDVTQLTQNAPTVVCGGPTDLWGENLTPEDINSANFEFQIPPTARITAVSITHPCKIRLIRKSRRLWTNG